MKVLFVCFGNLNRSQVAEAFFNQYSKKNKATSAGIGAFRYKGKHVGEFKNETEIMNALMAEEGFNFKDREPLQVTPEMIDEADLVVNMAYPDLTPDYMKCKKKIRNWDVQDVLGLPKEELQKIINLIKDLVRDLVQEIG
jgi:protein-tyrosine-phosphatase